MNVSMNSPFVLLSNYNTSTQDIFSFMLLRRLTSGNSAVRKMENCNEHHMELYCKKTGPVTVCGNAVATTMMAISATTSSVSMVRYCNYNQNTQTYCIMTLAAYNVQQHLLQLANDRCTSAEKEEFPGD
jgi:hypothetical protein